MRGIRPAADTIAVTTEDRPTVRKGAARVSVLDESDDGVRADLAEPQAGVRLDELKERAAKAPAAKDGVAALRGDGVKVICEVKRSSPSKGALAAIADPAGLA